ncbi:hypothetical protein ONS95_010273 [Cadophora gregata]|uniref:uncharacterized protein n=1 Tax=Cadophora gregata TaxID=51156 RepID=UPI0026DA9269|nr:uncharacterized protein ONS95_010273 [Cadophora gregata]KAK0122008.1 hypothetical protein ONS95_010273 [Cadophora gregata]
MSAASTPGSAPKAMSSRLLTMKFMQRAAHSSSPSAAPPSPDEPSPKRRRIDLSSTGTPSKVNVDALADRKAIQAALASEEAKRQSALEKQAAEAGDTRWVLSFEDQQHSAPSPTLALRVIQTGFANLDTSPSQFRITDDESDDHTSMVGRRSFGRFNKVLEKQQDISMEDSSETDDEDDESKSSGSDSDSHDPTGALIKASRQEAANRARAERKAKKRAAKAEAEELAKKRRKDVVNLNGLTSLSGKSAPVPACYNCGGPHYKKDCRANTNKRTHMGGDDGPPKKSLKFK